MWFDHANGNEKIKFMFNNELSIERVEFENVLVYDLSKVKIRFNSKDIPTTVPDKWKRNYFNAIYIDLVFVGLRRLILEGDRIGFECTPKFSYSGDITSLRIEDEKGILFMTLSAEAMVIDSIEPYLDHRWK